MAQVETRIIEGDRGGFALIHNGYRYQKNKVRQTCIYWRCWRRACRASWKSNHFDIDNNVAIDVLHIGNHEHAPDEEFILRQDIIIEIRNVIAEDPTDPVKRSYDRTVSRILHQDGKNRAEHVPEFYNIVAQLNRKKRQHVPDIPATVEQVEINNEWAETWDGQRNLLRQ